jgi:hypothetical protein
VLGAVKRGRGYMEAMSRGGVQRCAKLPSVVGQDQDWDAGDWDGVLVLMLGCILVE